MKTSLFDRLNAFEEAHGLPCTSFEELSWLHQLEGRRKAKQVQLAGEALDMVPFSRRQARKHGEFPSYAQLLTPRARQRIEAIYRIDFDAFVRYL